MTTLGAVSTRTATVSLRADGILQVVYFPNIRETLADAQANVAASRSLSPEKRRPLLVDIRVMRGIDRGARVYYSSAETAQTITALALLVESPLSRLLANFFMGLNKVQVPTRLFTAEDKAVEWLKGFSL